MRSADIDWYRYLRRLLALTVGIAGALYAFILILDPYQNVPFSPPLERAPIATNQRFSYPAVARDPRFDSAVIGTSTTRLLDPERLDALLGARFANLSMNSATAYEQQRMHGLFVRHHPALRYLVVGIDDIWCARRDDIERYTFRAFPEWMYDENRWNDLLYLFNDKALEQAVRMLELQLGLREPKYRPDGYRDFTADFDRYDPAQVARRLYGSAGPTAIADAEVQPSTARDWHYPLLGELEGLVQRTPEHTTIAFVLPPFHAHYIARNPENYAECKGRLLEIARRHDLTVLDYLYISPLTRNDANYWDPLHFTREVATAIETDLARVLTGKAPASAHVRRYP